MLKKDCAATDTFSLLDLMATTDGIAKTYHACATGLVSTTATTLFAQVVLLLAL